MLCRERNVEAGLFRKELSHWKFVHEFCEVEAKEHFAQCIVFASFRNKDPTFMASTPLGKFLSGQFDVNESEIDEMRLKFEFRLQKSEVLDFSLLSDLQDPHFQERKALALAQVDINKGKIKEGQDAVLQVLKTNV